MSRPRRQRTFDPRTFAGLRLWLDPRMLSGRDGDEIATWVDRSSQANHATSSTSGSRPTVKATTRRWMTALFDGSNDRLALANDTTGMPTSFFAAARQTTAGDTATRALLVTHVHGWYAPLGNAGGPVFWGNYESLAQDAGVGVGATNPPYVLACTATAFASIVMLTNGANKVTRTGATSGQARGSTALGADPTGVQFYAGDICEVLWWGVALSNGQRRDVEEYLHRRHAEPPSYALLAMPDSGP